MYLSILDNPHKKVYLMFEPHLNLFQLYCNRKEILLVDFRSYLSRIQCHPTMHYFKKCRERFLNRKHLKSLNRYHRGLRLQDQTVNLSLGCMFQNFRPVF